MLFKAVMRRCQHRVYLLYVRFLLGDAECSASKSFCYVVVVYFDSSALHQCNRETFQVIQDLGAIIRWVDLLLVCPRVHGSK